MDKQRQDEAQAEADRKARIASAAKLKAFYTLPRPGDDGYDEGFIKAIEGLDPEDWDKPMIRDAIKAHEPYRVAPKAPRDNTIPKEFWDRHLELEESLKTMPTDEEKVEAFRAATGRDIRGSSKEDWTKAHNLAQARREAEFRQSAQKMDAIRKGGIPGLEGSPAQRQPARQSPSTEDQQPNIPIVNSREEAMKLPSGTVFKTPDGRLKRVP
jgi:hypothetical protein